MAWPFCMQELCKLLTAGDPDIRAAIKDCMVQQPFKLICQRLLHHMDDSSLLGFLNCILGQTDSQRHLQQVAASDAAQSGLPMAKAAWASQQLEQILQLLIFGCIQWRELHSLLMHVALAFHPQQLQKAFQASDQLQVLLWLLAIPAGTTRLSPANVNTVCMLLACTSWLDFQSSAATALCLAYVPFWFCSGLHA